MMKKFIHNKESCLFLFLIAIEFSVFLYLALCHRIVGHDGLQYFQLQYYFLNSAVVDGVIPQWMPHLMHGMIANWWYASQAGLLQNVLVCVGPLLKSFDFLGIFYGGLFIDELLLLVGVWLLARRFFESSLTVFFVAAAVMGSCIWMTQPFFNFHFYYALPLILYFLHRFLDTLRGRYLFLSGNLLVMQNLGGPVYLITITTLVVFLYVLFYAIFNWKFFCAQIRSLKVSAAFIVCLGAGIFSLMLLYLLLSVGTHEIVSYDFGRDIKGRTTLPEFLSYGRNLGAGKWLEAFTGVSPAMDYTLYFGFLSAVFLILGLRFLLTRRYIHVTCLVVTLILFSAGSFVSVAAYHVWPMMKFYRHLALISPIIKLFLCFLAGVGFESFYDRLRHQKIFTGAEIGASAALMLAFMLFSIVLFNSGLNYANATALIERIFSQPVVHLKDGVLLYRPGLPLFNRAFENPFLGMQFVRTASVALFSSVIFSFPLFSRRKRAHYYFVALVLIFHLLDLYSYKFMNAALRTVPAAQELLPFMKFRDIPFQKRRQKEFYADEMNQPQMGAGHEDFTAGSRRRQSWWKPTADEAIRNFILQQKRLGSQLYAMNNLFFLKDEIGSAYRVDFWLLPIDRLMKAYWGQPLDDERIAPAGLAPFIRLDFPLSHPAVSKLVGLTEDKLQFFSDARMVENDEQVVARITDKSYSGDNLFIEGPLDKKDVEQKNIDMKDSPQNSTRENFSYQIQKFDVNHLWVTVQASDDKKSWLSYSDVWHPFWKATVNGKAKPVFRANLAYKAVELEPGENRVHFYFHSPLISFAHYFFAINSLLWLGIIFALAGQLLFKKSADEALEGKISSGR